MNKFKPDIFSKIGKHKVLHARVDAPTYEKIKAIADKYNIKINTLYRQMIYFALENLNDSVKT